MNVTDAVLSRSSTRAFLDLPISNKLIKKNLDYILQSSKRRESTAMENFCFEWKKYAKFFRVSKKFFFT